MVYIHNLIYGGKEITDGNVRNGFTNAIATRGYVNINNSAMGGDPLPGTRKQCFIRYRYYDTVGELVERTTWEGDNMDFGEPHLLLLEYGGVNIMGKADVVNRLKYAIRTWKRFSVNNDNCGGDTKPGVYKELNIVYRRAYGTANTQFLSGEGSVIYFEKQIFSIQYGNKLILDNAWVYANANNAYQTNYNRTNKKNHMRLTNENLGGDPQPGVRKKCTIEIDGWNSWKNRPEWLSRTYDEGAAWPKEPDSEGGIPGDFVEGKQSFSGASPNGPSFG